MAETFGAWVRKKRVARRWSQDELAARAGSLLRDTKKTLSQGHISLIERGGKTHGRLPGASREVIAAIGEALGGREEALRVAGYDVPKPAVPDDAAIEVIPLPDGKKVTLIGLDTDDEGRELVRMIIRRVTCKAA